MKVETTSGLILRTRPLTETSLIVHWLTPHLGRVATVAKGARRPKSPFAGKLDLFYTADFSFSRNRSSDLHNLREIKLQQTRPTIRKDIGKLNQAAYATACIEATTETETPLPEFFAIIEKFLDLLDREPARVVNIFALEIKLLGELGLAPDGKISHLTPGTKKIAQLLAEAAWPQILRVRTTAAQDQELCRWLDGLLILHLGKLPRGRAGAVTARC